MSKIETTIFAKKRTTKEGKSFYTYLTTLTKGNGETLTTSVKFAEGKEPKVVDCPLNIVIDKTECNLSTKRGVNAEGKEWASHTLWVKDYTKSETPWVDDSMDEFV